MTIIAHNPKSFAPHDGDHTGVGTGFLVAWSCTRKPACGNGAPGRMLERVQLVLRIEPLDRTHAMLEAWLESEGVRTGTIHAARRHRCHIAEGAGMLHIDARDDAGDCLAALSLTNNNGDPRSLVYAQTALLSRAGLAAGGYDAPALRATSV